MGIRLSIAKAASSILTWGLQKIAHRPGGNTPGFVALKIDADIISELRSKCRCGSIVVVGTNGKTTVTNLLANVIEASGHTVICNRTGANLNTGIATALLQGRPSDWGVIECDELWSAKVVPQLQPKYYLLLNLFRDQLDRCGEIDHIQDAIVSALEGSPETTLIYNADDPLCEMVADRVAKMREGSTLPESITFGTLESMGLAQNMVADATMCQRCSHMFKYKYRQYGQLGDYFCESCGFARPALNFAARDIEFGVDSLTFEVAIEDPTKRPPIPGQTEGMCIHEPPRMPLKIPIHTNLNGTYMVYNLLAVSAAAMVAGCSVEALEKAIADFDPKNGRLERYVIGGRPVLLNLAKNPTGFNQNLRIIEADKSQRAVAFFINDEVVDGHDISWIWDIDFEELVREQGVIVFAGGSRKNDLQVRLKYAGVKATLVDGIEQVFDLLDDMDEVGRQAPVYAIANYTALPPVKRALDKMAAGTGTTRDKYDKGTVQMSYFPEKKASSANSPQSKADDTESVGSPIVIAHILPDLLNLYGDGGNVRVLEQRLEWRGIPVEVRRVRYGETVDFDDLDLVVLGGSPDKEQKLASEKLRGMRDELAKYVESGAPLLAICGSYQMLGRVWLVDGESVEGLNILDIETRRPGDSTDRLVDNIALDVPFAAHPVIGYENHAGRTYLDDGVEPFGRVVSKVGAGNNDAGNEGAADSEEGAGESCAHYDGVLYKNVIGTYLHGPILSKNPEVADHLLAQAIERHAMRTGEKPAALEALDDSEELAANEFMAKKLL